MARLEFPERGLCKSERSLHHQLEQDIIDFKYSIFSFRWNWEIPTYCLENCLSMPAPLKAILNWVDAQKPPIFWNLSLQDYFTATCIDKKGISPEWDTANKIVFVYFLTLLFSVYLKPILSLELISITPAIPPLPISLLKNSLVRLRVKCIFGLI